MNMQFGCQKMVVGLVAVLLFMGGGSERPAVAQEEVVKQWDTSDFVEAKSFICAWQEGQGDGAIRVIKDQGFEIVDVQEGEWAVCKWEGRLDKDKLDVLRNHVAIRYVEPNFPRWITPNVTQGNVHQTVEFKPVFTPDNVLPELNRTGRMICAWEKGKAKEAVQAVQNLGLKVVDVQEGEWIVCTWEGKLTQETINKLTADPSINYIEPDEPRGIGRVEIGDDQIVRAKAEAEDAQADPKDPFAILPQDEFIKQLYGMRNIDAPIAWRSVQVSPVVVAVCDTGVDYTHEDLRDNMWQNPKKDAPDRFGADFIDIKVDVEGDKPKATPGSDPRDRHFHGTHVAGIIGAVGNNKLGVSGVCWRVQIMAVRCLGSDGRANSSSVARAIEYAVDNGAKVINLSLGGRRGPLQTELNALKEAREKGVIVVISAGNKEDDEIDNDKKDQWPANYTRFVDNIVVVANTDINNKLNPGSHFGKTTVIGCVVSGASSVAPREPSALTA